jgi:hypothetical protein
MLLLQLPSDGKIHQMKIKFTPKIIFDNSYWKKMLSTSQIDSTIVKNVLLQLNSDPSSGAINFQNDDLTIRKTRSFGYDFFSLINNNKKFVQIPLYLKELCRLCIHSFPADFNLGNPQDYLNIIVSFYHSGYLLEPHFDVDFSDRFVDGKQADFYFGENVIGVILQADSHGRFYILKSENDLQDRINIMELNEEVGTVFLLQGDLRRKPYYHGVSQVMHSRISVTFRTVSFVR